jgi:hypothetical protein
MSETVLNWPFFTYPGTPMHGYQKYITYRMLAKKCHRMIIQCSRDINKQQLFQLSIGALNEELQIYLPDSAYDFQYQQLSPYHITNYLIKGGSVIHFIISPNNSFNTIDSVDYSSSFSEPFFIKLTKTQFDWGDPVISSDGMINYSSKKYDYNIFIFCTMMPSIDPQNKSIIDRVSSKGEFMKEKIMPYIQTEIDKVFVNQFYIDLQKLITNVVSFGGIFICFSFVVFNELTDNSKYKNYALFSEIKNLFTTHPKSTILAEWTFRRGVYLMKHFKGYDSSGTISISDKYISYVVPDSVFKDGYQIIISDNEYLLIPSKEFIDCHETSNNMSYYSDDIIYKYSKMLNISNNTTNYLHKDISQLIEEDVKDICICIIKKEFSINIIQQYISEFNIFNYKKICDYDDKIVDIYLKLISGDIYLANKHNINISELKLGLLGLFALSLAFNCKIKYENVYIIHPNVKITNGCYIDATKFKFI